MTMMRVRPEIIFFMAIILSPSSCSRLPSGGDLYAYWRSEVARVELKYGKQLHKAGKVEEAISHYEVAIANDPTLSEAEFFLGLAWADLEDRDQAIRHYERCLSLDPKDAKCEANLAGILV